MLAEHCNFSPKEQFDQTCFVIEMDLYISTIQNIYLIECMTDWKTKTVTIIINIAFNFKKLYSAIW